MHSKRPIQRQPKTFDPALIGKWSDGVGQIAIHPDGWYLALDRFPATISPDGQTLAIGETMYSRSYGSGQFILGDWRLVLAIGNDTLVEDWYFRSNGTYTSQWTKNGAFDSVYFGQYAYENGMLAIEERRVMITTGPGNAIHFEVPFGDDDTGTYALPAPDQLAWTFNGVTTTLDRI